MIPLEKTYTIERQYTYEPKDIMSGQEQRRKRRKKIRARKK